VSKGADAPHARAGADPRRPGGRPRRLPEFEAFLSAGFDEAGGHAAISDLRACFEIPEEDLLSDSCLDLVLAGIPST
jgi:hypothetical protein